MGEEGADEGREGLRMCLAGPWGPLVLPGLRAGKTPPLLGVPPTDVFIEGGQ